MLKIVNSKLKGLLRFVNFLNTYYFDTKIII